MKYRNLTPQQPTAGGDQPSRRALQEIAWKLVDPDARVEPADLAEDIERKRNLFFCRKSGLKECSDPTLPGVSPSL